MKQRSLSIFLIILATLSLVQCGDRNSVNSKIKFTVIPKTPIVILSDFTLNPGDDNEKLIKAPWFYMTYSIANNSDQTVTIQSLLFTISSMSKSGGVKSTSFGVDPGDYEDFLPHEPVYLTEIAPNTEDTATFGVYVYGLDPDAITYNYSVEVNVQGWVGTFDQPVDRLTKKFNFTTK